MAGFLPPLVRGATRGGLAWIGLYVLAGTAGGAAVGGTVGCVGQVLDPWARPLFGPAFLGIAALAALWDVGWLRTLLPERKRQVPVSWMANHGPCRAILLYGVSMGSGLVTYVSFGAFYVLLAWAAVTGPIPGALLLGFYGGAQALPVVAAAINLRRGLPPPVGATSFSAAYLHAACAVGSAWLFVVRILMI